jgi:hypothetical protein
LMMIEQNELRHWSIANNKSMQVDCSILPSSTKDYPIVNLLSFNVVRSKPRSRITQNTCFVNDFNKLA